MTKKSKKPTSPRKRWEATVRRKLWPLLRAGYRLSNVAYNLKQMKGMPELERSLLKEGQETWDNARDKLPRWLL